MRKKVQYLLLFFIITLMISAVIFDVPNYFFFGFFVFIIIMAFTAGVKQNQFEYQQQILATSKINSVASGLAEIIGLAKPYTESVSSPIAGSPCVAYIYTVEEKRVSRDSDGHKQVDYSEIERKIQCDRFYLQDDSGQIEIDATDLSWFGFDPATEYHDGSYRYREYILDETSEILMIGQAWYADNRFLFKYSQDKQIFAMAPYKWVQFRNKWRPLKHRAGFMLALLGLIVVFILWVPIYIDGTKLVFDLNNAAGFSDFFN